MSQSDNWHTPTLQVHDPRALGIRKVEYLRTVAGEDVQALITRKQYDVAGRLVAHRDPRLPAPNTFALFALNGQALRTASVDAGIDVILHGLGGLPAQSWSANGNHRVVTYDGQLRPLTIEENGTPNVETMTYADVNHNPGHNLRGKLVERSDPSGNVEFHSIGLTGGVLHDTRTFHDGKAFVSRHTFSPLSVVLKTIDAGGHTQRSRCDVAGQLIHTQLQLNGQPDLHPVLKDARYNAAGQIIERLAGNGVLSRWLYDPAIGRLHRQIAQSGPATVHQDFEYRYDRVGNIIAILDHAFTPRFFANRHITNDRTFTYDSLYRLHSASGHADAPPSDNPARPQPTDPNDRRPYTETYAYDDGSNLIKTIHVREGANHTREIFVDPASNRGVRWKQGDPTPDFDRLYSRAGNLLALQPGMPLHWNIRGELETLTLVDRNGSSANDEEYYRYSQGERVYKRHETHTTTMTHFHEVRYLPGLEIRTRDNGEELHRINLGGAVCLHWVAGKPPDIAADQLRFRLEDHLGSAVKELDGQARLISEETYLPFGASATLTARSAVEVDYKTLRYSGKEMDVSGCYYYGARYYAPWLGRWTAADPSGTVDGLNLYAFVGNNPIIHVDKTGNAKALFDVAKGFIGVLDRAATAAGQLHNLASEFDGLVPEDADINELRESITFGTFMKSRHGIKSALYGAIKGAGVGGLIGTAVPGIGNLIGTGVGTLAGAIVFPLLRYYFFKKSLKAVQTLRTREIAATVTAAAETTASAVEGAQNLIKGGSELLQSIKDATDNLSAYPQRLQDMFYGQLDDLGGNQQREVMKLLKTGVDPFDAIDQVLNSAQQLKDSPSEADSVTARLAQLAQQVSDESLKKPIPKPRTKMQHRVQRTTSETYV
ncbi:MULTISPECIES: RHS repeat-associated core domain-containing protein [unclassified Pseudomonas]|uniref:RHS repeat-associated core domain-containing protein n=1 Tax=unclassified Pseudomonas TaxID=196821 RepID=UPI000A1E955C|nr:MULTISPECIES: RHS repeat-associated core domain-containing protein [unclassified Pseudomonas]